MPACAEIRAEGAGGPATGDESGTGGAAPSTRDVESDGLPSAWAINLRDRCGVRGNLSSNSLSSAAISAPRLQARQLRLQVLDQGGLRLTVVLRLPGCDLGAASDGRIDLARRPTAVPGLRVFPESLGQIFQSLELGLGGLELGHARHDCNVSRAGDTHKARADRRRSGDLLRRVRGPIVEPRGVRQYRVQAGQHIMGHALPLCLLQRLPGDQNSRFQCVHFSSPLRAFAARLRDVERVVVGPERCLAGRSEEHTSELQSRLHLVCRLLLEKKKKKKNIVSMYN